MPLRLVFALLLFASVALPASTAEAGVYITFSRDHVQLAQKEPARFVVTFDEELYRASISVTGPNLSKRFDLKPVEPGKEYAWEWPVPVGTSTYEVKVEMVDDQANKTYQDASLQITGVPALTASIPLESVDVAGRGFDVVSSHPPSSVEIEVMGDDLRILGTSTFMVSGAEQGRPVRVTWDPTAAGNIFRIGVTVRDEWEQWTSFEIVPWTLAIPHEDVNFPTNESTILPEEAPKVDRAYVQIVDIAAKYKEWVQCHLYVAGYTDTVGDGSSNQALSEKRALALARYFQQKGLKLAIHYQGFGESVLAVETGDSVDEVLNRRALYLITAGPPPRSKDTPRAGWKRLQ